jgi:DNA-binding beta-propeller fold protein YncE
VRAPVVSAAALLAVVTPCLAAFASVFPPHVLVTTSDGVNGSLTSVDPAPPWPSSIGLETVGAVTAARHWNGLHYIVNRSPEDDIQVIDPRTWLTLRRIPAGSGADPHDIVVMRDTKAFVSLHARPYVLIVDPSTGSALDSLDLSLFADSDGVPDMSRMETDGVRVYVQIQRLELTGGGGTTPVPPSLLAVIDAVQDTVVDVDPASPGTQAISLTGVHPVNDMYIEGNRLYLIEQGSGDMADPDGGIDVIDLVSLQALGFLTSESQLGGHADCFVLVSPTKGYAVTHTDWTLSSHLTPFSRLDGSIDDEIFATYEALTDQLAYDPITDYLYFPANATFDSGIRVFDATTGSMLTPSPSPVPTGLPPRDVLIARSPVGTGVPASGPDREVAIRLGRPRPNPFRTSTEIRFSLARPALVTAAIYDIAGRHRLARRGGILGVGEQTILWNGQDRDGHAVPPGLYFVRLSTGTETVVQTIVRLR